MMIPVLHLPGRNLRTAVVQSPYFSTMPNLTFSGILAGDAHYRQLLAVLEHEPEWNDGEIVYVMQGQAMTLENDVCHWEFFCGDSQ
jgi:hypothetical protein